MHGDFILLKGLFADLDNFISSSYRYAIKCILLLFWSILWVVIYFTFYAVILIEVVGCDVHEGGGGAAVPAGQHLDLGSPLPCLQQPDHWAQAEFT